MAWCAAANFRSRVRILGHACDVVFGAVVDSARVFRAAVASRRGEAGSWYASQARFVVLGVTLVASLHFCFTV